MFVLLKIIIFIVLGNHVDAKIIVYAENGSVLEEFVERGNSKIWFPAFFNPFKKGVMHLGDPVDGCSFVRNTSGFDSTLNHFVLVDANGCPFETKVLSVQDAGYSAVLLARSKNATPEKEDGIVSEIPVLIVTEADFRKISDNYLFTVNHNYRVIVTVGVQEVVLSVCIALIFTIIVVGFLLIVGKKVRSLRRRGLLGVPRYRRGNSLQICTICLCYMEEGQLVAEVMPCLHVFHHLCIQEWIDKSSEESNELAKCPNCKQVVRSCRVDQVVPTEVTPLLRNAAIND